MMLLAALRHGTAEVHEALHEHAFMRQHFYEHMTPQVYRGFLGLFLERLRTLERALFYHADAHLLVGQLHLRVVRRTSVLSEDLGVSEQGGGDTPLSALHTTGHAYSLVGSSKGARVLRAHVLRQLPTAPLSICLVWVMRMSGRSSLSCSPRARSHKPSRRISWQVLSSVLKLCALVLINS
jgi:hypothetical protein